MTTYHYCTVFVWERSILVCVVYDDLIYKCNLMLICNGSKTINYIKKKNQLNIKVRTCTYCLNMDNFFKFLHCRVKVKISLIWFFNSYCMCKYLVNQYNGSFTRGCGFKIFLQTNLITKMEKKTHWHHSWVVDDVKVMRLRVGGVEFCPDTHLVQNVT